MTRKKGWFMSLRHGSLYPDATHKISCVPTKRCQSQASAHLRLEPQRVPGPSATKEHIDGGIPVLRTTGRCFSIQHNNAERAYLNNFWHPFLGCVDDDGWKGGSVHFQQVENVFCRPVVIPVICGKYNITAATVANQQPSRTKVYNKENIANIVMVREAVVEMLTWRRHNTRK